MDEVISKILQMDETARKMDEEAQAERIASHEEVLKKRAEVYEEYLEHAKTHVEQYKAAERKANEELWKKTEKHYDEVSKELDRQFSNNKNKWIDEIVNGVLSFGST